MTIEDAKEELYSKLKSNDNIVGAGVHTVNNEDVICIYLIQSSTETPVTYNGFKVITEVTGEIKFQINYCNLI